MSTTNRHMPRHLFRTSRYKTNTLHRNITVHTWPLFSANNSSQVNKTEVIPGISDHEIVDIESNLKSIRATQKLPRKLFLYLKAKTEQIKEKLNNINRNDITNLEKLTMNEL